MLALLRTKEKLNLNKQLQESFLSLHHLAAMQLLSVGQWMQLFLLGDEIYVMIDITFWILQAELGRPLASRPNQGKVEINVECSPTAAPQFEVFVSNRTYML